MPAPSLPLWLPFTSVANGYMPFVTVRMIATPRSTLKEFILDSGASQTIAPQHFAAGLCDVSGVPLEDTGLLDAHGQPLKGRKKEMMLQLGHLPPFAEQVWFVAGARFGCLGQTTAFEHFVVRFNNHEWNPNGRRFGLWKPPA